MKLGAFGFLDNKIWIFGSVKMYLQTTINRIGSGNAFHVQFNGILYVRIQTFFVAKKIDCEWYEPNRAWLKNSLSTFSQNRINFAVKRPFFLKQFFRWKYMKMFANWCENCQMLRWVFGSSEIIHLLTWQFSFQCVRCVSIPWGKAST